MEYREFDTSITYDSNCHYEESSTHQSIKIPLREVDITFLTFINTERNNTQLYYNDPIHIQIFIKDKETNSPVQWGNVTFYYVDQDDATHTMQQINIDPIPIDINGNAAIQYIPHNNGEIYVEYNGDPYYVSTNQREIIPTLLARPTYIEFKDFSPYLVDPEQKVTMTVNVKDAYTNQPLEYGIVTFLNYHAFNINLPNDGYEKVIGNPKYLLDGEANISYSPIQLGTNDLYNNIELIRASYNYDNELYGVQWKYYKEHNDYTAIAIRRNNQINLFVPKTQKNDTISNIICNDEGLFVLEENESIICQCQVTANNMMVDNADVFFVVEGYYISYENDTPTQNDYKQIFNASLMNENDEYYFESIISVLKEGLYQIHAEVQNPIIKIDDNTEYELPVYNNNTPNTPTTNKNDDAIGNKIIDGIYLKSNESESFYVKITPKTNKLNLLLSVTEPLTTNRILTKDKVILTIDTNNLTNDDINVLKNKECYFYIPSLNKTYSGTIKYQNNKLKASPNENITLLNVNDYVIYAYILGKTYTYKINNQTITREYTTTYSNSEIIKSRDQLDASIRINTIDNTYPGKIQYIVDINNISLDTINFDVSVDNTIINTHTVSNINSQVISMIPPTAVGIHTLKVQVTTPGYESVIATKDFTIEKANLNILLNNHSKNILTTSQGDISFNITHTKSQPIGMLDINNFSPIIKKGTQIQDKTTLMMTSTTTDDKNYIITVTGKIYDDGDWETKLNYDGDNNYNSTDNNYETFYASNETPYCINTDINFDNDTITNKIVYSQSINTRIETINNIDTVIEYNEYNSIHQYILVINTLLDSNGNNIGAITSITDINGEYILKRANTNISDVNWSKCSTIEYEIIPKDTILTNFKNAKTEAAAVTAFKNKFNNHQCTDAEIINLYRQSKEHNYENLFLGYNYIKDSIDLYGDNDGS